MRSTRRRWLLAVGALATSAGVGTLVHASTSARPATGDGVVGATPATAVVGRFADVSDDGRWVVYEGRPLGPDTRASTVFLRDRTVADPARAVTELTAPSPDLRSGESVRPVISGDGCVVVVVTQFAFDLFRDDDTGERWDVYRQVLPHCGGAAGDWELVSATGSADGGLAAGDRTVPTERPAVSESGAVVAFTHRASGPKATLMQVTVVDLTVPLGDAGRSTPVPGTPLDQPATEFVHRGQFEPALSADGRTVAFTSDALADAAVPAWGSGPVPGGPASTQVYVWDRDAGPLAGVMLVSGRNGVAAATGADQPAVSGSGRFVAFRTAAPDLLDGVQLPDCTGGCPAQVVRHDLEDGSLVVVSAAAAAGADESAPRLAADGASGWPAITDDGSQVAFVTRARNLVALQSAAGVEADDGDVLVAEVDRAALRRVSVLGDGGTPLPATNAHPAMSGSGHLVLFDSLAAAELAPGSVLSGVAASGGRHVVALERPTSLSTSALDVGMVVVGLPGPEWYVAVRNDGPSTFVPATVTSDDEQFVVTGGTCGLGLPVAPGEACTVYVTFTPAAEGPSDAVITVGDELLGGTSISIAVTGTGGEPSLEPSPAGADFDPTDVGGSGRTVAFDITNIGFSVTTLAGFELTGSHPDDFEVVGGSCDAATLGPLTSCAVEVAFSPTDVGYRSAVLRVVTETGQYTTVLLNGEGTRVAQLVVADDEVRAGDDIGVGGSGFTPGSTVTIGWADGRGRSVTVVADAAGSFLATFPTRPNEPAGTRTVVAHTAELSAAVEVEVLRRRTSSSTGL